MESINSSWIGKMIQWVKFIPLILFGGIAPLVVRLRIINYDSLSSLPWYPSSYIVSDFYNVNKSQAILWAGALALVFIIGWIVLKGFQFSKWHVGILGFVVLVLASTIQSKFPNIAWTGYAEKMQGTWVWLAYAVIFLYGTLIVRTREDIRILLRVVQFSAVFILVISAFQTFGIDFFKTDFGARILLGSDYYKEYGSQALNFQFRDTRAYGTMYNPNYLGSYLAVLIPLSIYGYKNETKRGFKALWIGIVSLGLISLVGSLSRGAFAGLIGATIFGILFVIFRLRENRFKIIGTTIGMIMVALVLINFIDSLFFQRIQDVFKSTPINTRIESVYNTSDKIVFTLSSGEVIDFTYEIIDGSVHADVVNEEGNEYELLAGMDKYYHLSSIEDVRFQFGKTNSEPVIDYVTFDIADERWDFAYTDTGVRFINPLGKKDVIITTGSQYDGYLKWGSNRGYIWSRSIPILKNAGLLGYGSDTYAMVFPQNDYLMKEKVFSTRAMIVDKAHSAYLGMGIEFGWLTLLWVNLGVVYIGVELLRKTNSIILPVILISNAFVAIFNDNNIHSMFVVVFALIVMLYEIKRQGEVETEADAKK